MNKPPAVFWRFMNGMAEWHGSYGMAESAIALRNVLQNAMPVPALS